MTGETREFLEHQHPYAEMAPERLEAITRAASWIEAAPGDTVFARGTPLPGLYIVRSGHIEITDEDGTYRLSLPTGQATRLSTTAYR